MPCPKDIEKLGSHLKKQINEAVLDKEEVSWELTLYRLDELCRSQDSYNRRRSGEIDGIWYVNLNLSRSLLILSGEHLQDLCSSSFLLSFKMWVIYIVDLT